MNAELAGQMPANSGVARMAGGAESRVARCIAMLCKKCLGGGGEQVEPTHAPGARVSLGLIEQRSALALSAFFCRDHQRSQQRHVAKQFQAHETRGSIRRTREEKVIAMRFRQVFRRQVGVRKQGDRAREWRPVRDAGRTLL